MIKFVIRGHKITALLFFKILFSLKPFELRSQKDGLEERDNVVLSEDNDQLIFNCEPGFLSSEEEKKKAIRLTRSIFDTICISDHERKKLLKDLYKKCVSERLTKILVVDTKF